MYTLIQLWFVSVTLLCVSVWNRHFVSCTQHSCSPAAIGWSYYVCTTCVMEERGLALPAVFMNETHLHNLCSPLMDCARNRVPVLEPCVFNAHYWTSVNVSIFLDSRSKWMFLTCYLIECMLCEPSCYCTFSICVRSLYVFRPFEIMYLWKLSCNKMDIQAHSCLVTVSELMKD